MEKKLQFSDLELGFLTHHLLHKCAVVGMGRQREFNRLFSNLKLERFESKTIDPQQLSRDLSEYTLGQAQVLLMLEALDNPMLGLAARIIGVDSPFFNRLAGQFKETPEEDKAPEPNGAAPDGEGSEAPAAS